MRIVGVVLSLCLLAGMGHAQSVSLAPEQIEQMRRTTAYQLSQNPQNRTVRFRHAQASYQVGNHDAARYHLQQLMRTSPNARDLEKLYEAYAIVVAKSPWSFGLNFSFLPSTNVNKTSSNEIFETPLGPLLIAGGGAEESGVGVRYGARVNYESILSTDASLTYGFEINRNQFPADRLNNIDGTIRLSWRKVSLSGQTTVAPFVTRHIYEVTERTSSNSTRYGLQVGHEHFLTFDSSITGMFTAERRDYDDKKYLDGSFFSTSLSYQNRVSDSYHVRFQTGISASTPQEDHLRYTAITFSGELTRSVKSLGSIGINIGLGKRAHKANFPLLGKTREDRSASIGFSFRPQKLRVLGASPKVSCVLQKNRSNIALYEYKSTDCTLTFERNF